MTDEQYEALAHATAGRSMEQVSPVLELAPGVPEAEPVPEAAQVERPSGAVDRPEQA